VAERVGSGQLLPGVTSPGVKEFRQGTHRTVSPAETVARARSLMAAMGITRIANITGLDRIGIPVAVACRPNSRSLAVSQGKGLDPEAAQASALMESIELHHAEHITLPVKFGSYEDLKKTHSLAEVEKLPRVHNSLFHPHLALLWVEGFDLLQQRPAWVPFEMVSMNYTLPFPPGSGCFQATSNGLASGNHLLEAVSQGICEVVERDATTLWRLSREASQRARLVDLTTVDDPACREALEKFERAGVAVAAWETTTDVGIPAFRCTIAERRDDPLRPLYTIDGMGCHPSRSIALLRALTEAAQGRLTYIAGSRDDLYRETYELASSPATAQRKRRQMKSRGRRRGFRDAPDWQGETLLEDVLWELERLQKAGIEQVVVVDLTRPEFRVPVVRVVIPGLEGIYPEPDYAPGARAQALLESQS